MHNKQLIFFISAMICCAFFLSCNSIKREKFPYDEIINPKYSSFTEKADSYLKEQNFQGTVLVSKGKKIIFAKGYGTSDKKNKANPKNTIHTTFETGSITKQMTAACIMQLVEKKKLSLDSQISDFFPEYEHGKNITIRMLLNMRSGLTDHINAGDEFFSAATYHKILKAEAACENLPENLVLDSFYDAPVMASPDSTYFYCNTNYYLLAKIIEQLGGLSYEEYLEKNIFKKSGMNTANVKFQKTDAKGYDYRNRYYSIPAEMALGCGDVNGSVIDLYKWNYSFVNNKIVSRNSFKEMINSDSYGFGIYCKKDKKNKSILHAGATDVFNSYDIYYFKDKVSIIVLVNKPIGECNATIIAGNLRNLMKK